METHNERVNFRLIQMPCCSHLLCWVNPRLPNYCPECGQLQANISVRANTMISDDEAWLKYHA